MVGSKLMGCGTISVPAGTLPCPMERIDALPAEQKAVLQLVLAQGKSYGERAALLRSDETSMRRRAHDAAAALGPSNHAWLTDDQRSEITDWLLGQGGAARAEHARELLAGSQPAREWARAVAGELKGLGGERLPSIPEEPAAAPAAPAAAPAAPAAAIAPEPAATAAAPGSGPRVSRRGGALLIAAAVIVVGVVLVLLLSGGGGDNGTNAADTATTASRTSAAAPARVTAHANPIPPSRAPAKNAPGLVQIVDVSGQQAINAVVQGLQQGKKSGYGIWLYASPSKEKWLGYFST